MNTRQLLDPTVRRARADRKAKRRMLRQYPSVRANELHARLTRISKDSRIPGWDKELRYWIAESKWREQEGI